jgi:hypothetical protein
MSSSYFGDYARSPTMLHRPQPLPFPPPNQEQPFNFQSNPPSNHSSVPPLTQRPSLVSKPSRKRSRDQVDDDASQPTQINGSMATMDSQPEPTPLIYGEGMTLIDPATGRAMAAESQTGTWLEDYLEEERLANEKAAKEFAEEPAAPSPERPGKSMRLDLGNRETPSTTSTHPPTPAAPVIDAASMLLGIGWKSIASAEHMESAARGWAKYIQNHYPTLSNVSIVLKSEGLEAYLVRATETVGLAGLEGFYLFAEHLNEGRLVARSQEECVVNLRTSPIVYAGQETLRAATIPCWAPGVSTISTPGPEPEAIIGKPWQQTTLGVPTDMDAPRELDAVMDVEMN